MIERYSRPEMANIWTEENKYRAWLEVEILADEAWAELGEIPKEDVALIREKADFDIDRILEIEQQTRHDGFLLFGGMRSGSFCCFWKSVELSFVCDMERKCLVFF